MAYTPVRLYIGQPGTTETTLVPAITGSRIVKQVVVTNTAGTSSSLSLSLIPSGGSAGVTNRLVANFAVAAGAVTTLDLTQVMSGGDAISALQTVAGALTVTISGVSF